MRRIIFLVFILLISINSLFSQTIDDGKAHRRYWYYRTRMINDFMKIGKEQGACIVFAERNNGYSGGTTPEFESKVGPDQIDITNMYIMALALEYKLLSRNGQDTKETIKELFHLLFTINRLDLEAEQYWTVYNSNEIIQPNGLLNGFMLREDMPRQFMNDNITHYNYSLLENNYPAVPTPTTDYGGFTGIMHTNALTNDNKFTGFLENPNKQPKEDLTLVQDKYMSMLTAMEFVNKYIPSGVSYTSATYPNGEPFQDNEISIKAEAGNIANRCYNYLRNKNGLWQLRYVDMNGNYKDPLSAGAGAFTYSWPLSRMACYANTPFPWNQNNPGINYCQGYNDIVATASGKVHYSLLSQAVSSCFDDNAVFLAWCHAGSNAPSYTSYGTVVPIYTLMGANTAYNSLEWAELLRKVLHQDGALLRQQSIYANPIDEAPCNGPYNYGNCDNGGPEWSSQDRLEHPISRNFGCNSNTPAHANPCYNYVQNRGFQGNYPGVDYMLLHNLYYEYQNQLLDGHNGNVNSGIGGLVSTIYNAATQIGNGVAGLFGQGNSGAGNGGTWSSSDVVGYENAYNYMDNKDENIWPRKIIAFPGSFMIQGTDNFPGKVAVFQYLTSKAHIYYTSSPAAPSNSIPSNVTYRAGKEIVFEPGFQVDAGSTFHGYIARYLCDGGNSDAMNMRHANTNDSLYNYLYTNDYEGDDINPIPIHYVESPKSDSDLHPVVSETSEVYDMVPVNNSNYIPSGSDFNIWPNPSSGVFKIQSKKTADDEKLSVRIFDMKGQLVFSMDDIGDEQEINLASYSKGIYLAQIFSSLGSSKSKKIEIAN